MNRTFLLGSVLLGVAAYAGFSFSHDGPTPVHRTTTATTLSVTVTTPFETTVVERVAATGTLVPREDVAVMAEVANVRILSLPVEVGDRVRRGDTLAVLDTESLRLQVLQMEAEYAKARDEHARVNSIKDSGAVSKSIVTEKKSALDAAKAKLDEAKLAVRRAVVTAPEDGTVFERRATVGTVTAAGEPLFRIARNGVVEADLRVPEGSAGRVPPGGRVSLFLPGLDSPVAGTVRLVAPRIDAADRAASVRVSMPADRPLMVGAFVHGDVELGTVTALAVPSTAVQRDAAGAFVWTVDLNDRVDRRGVQPRLRQDGLTLVDGVDPGLRVVVRAGSLVRSGDRVKTIEAR